MILAAATDWQESHHFLAKLSGKPLMCFVPSAKAACLAVLSCYFPNTAEAAESRTSSAATKRMTLRAYFQQLYGYATGWLGWTPSETWNTSLVEIGAHIDRLVKMNPDQADIQASDSPRAATSEYTPERLREIEDLGYDPAFNRQALRALKARHT